MSRESVYENGRLRSGMFAQERAWAVDWNMPRRTVIGLILGIALIAFELFNFDTTRFALRDLLGDVSFWGASWAGILAIAFCAIDFAGLARLFTPEQGEDEPKAVWYLMGAWLLGATMNAIMTWWAVSLTLLSHQFGNEVLSRDQLLQIVPVFVAALVWLTRILFIGAFSVAGEHLFDLAGQGEQRDDRQYAPVSKTAVSPQQTAQPKATKSTPKRQPARSTVRKKTPTRVRQRPPMPRPVSQTVPLSAKARQ